MTDRRKVRLSDWLNGGVGALMVLSASWAGLKLTTVSEDVAYVKAKVEAETHLIKGLKEDYEAHDDTLDDHEKRLTKVETTLGLGD